MTKAAPTFSQFFYNLSIKTKLISVILLTTCITLLLASSVSVFYKINTFRAKIVDETDTLAKVVGYNSASAVIFADPNSATETLSSIKANSSVVSALIYTPDIKVFAKYFRAGEKEDFPKGFWKNKHWFDANYLYYTQSIIYQGNEVGIIYVKSDLRKLEALIQQDLIFMALLLLVCVFIALGLSNTMQKAISNPIFDLVNVTKSISETKDYTTRAKKFGEDEVGILVDSFNSMIQKIQSHDAEIRAKELYFRTLIENATDLITIIDREGIITYQSPSAKRILGYEPQEMIGKNFFSFLYPKEVSAVKATLDFSKKDLLYSPFIKMGVTLKDKEGMWRLLEGIFNNLYDDPSVKGMIINIRDVVDRKKFEDRLKRSIAVKNEFMSDVTSRMKKPLSVISSSLTILNRKNIDDPLRQKLLSMILDNTRRLDTMLNQQILDMSKFEVGKMELQRQSIDVIRTIKEIFEDLQFVVFRDQIRFELDSEDEWIFLSVDKLAFMLVVSTLLINAIKVTPKGGKITVKVESTNEICTVAVIDQGPGIAHSDFARLFKRSKDLTRRFANEEIPIGLDDVRALAKIHGGEFKVASVVGKGSTFSFTIPIMIVGFEY